METKVIKLSKYNINEIFDLISQNNSVNLVLDLEETSISESELDTIFNFAISENENGTTFVVVKTSVDLDNLSEEWNIVPTLQEAKDLISLDEMMRDLE
jgi:hypothetical protein